VNPLGIEGHPLKVNPCGRSSIHHLHEGGVMMAVFIHHLHEGGVMMAVLLLVDGGVMRVIVHLQRLIRRLLLLKISNSSNDISDLVGEERVLIMRMRVMMKKIGEVVVKGNHTMIPIFAVWLVSRVQVQIVGLGWEIWETLLDPIL